jgi:hypothetical protein
MILLEAHRSAPPHVHFVTQAAGRFILSIVMAARAAKPWTSAEDRQLIELRKAGKTTAYIAKTMGRSEEGVRQRLGGIGLRGTGRLIPRRYTDLD